MLNALLSRRHTLRECDHALQTGSPGAASSVRCAAPSRCCATPDSVRRVLSFVYDDGMVDLVALQQLFSLPVIQLQTHAAHFGALQESEVVVRLLVARALDQALNPEVGARREQQRCGSA